MNQSEFRIKKHKIHFSAATARFKSNSIEQMLQVFDVTFLDICRDVTEAYAYPIVVVITTELHQIEHFK